MAQLLNIAFKKNDLYSSWGFQVCGGRDSWRPLTVRNVQSGTLAYNYLNVGDRVLEIDGIDCYSLTESQAISFLRRPSNSIELLVLKRRGENIVPPKRSSSCKALQNFSFPKPQSISEPSSPPQHIFVNDHTETFNAEKDLHTFNNSEKLQKQPSEEQETKKDLESVPKTNHNNGTFQFSNFRPRRNSLQKDSEPIRLRSRSSSPQFWKLNSETLVTGPSTDCRNFWKKLEKCSMEDLSARHTPSPVRPASVAFYPKTPEPNNQPKTEIVSPKKKVTFSNILLERNYLQTDLPDLSPGSRVDEEFNKIYNSSKQDEQHQIGAKNVAGDMSASPPPAPPPPLHSGGTAQGGPPPPPPPPPMLHSGHIPAIRIKTELNGPREIPSTIQNAMASKDKKPFTYLPGGLDLSEIRSPRMQRRLERNAQTPPSPELTPQKSPEYQQPVAKPNFEQKPLCNVRTSAERICLLPQVQHQPQLNKSPTPWMQKAANIQPNPAPWTQNKKEYVDQVDKSEERIVPLRVENNRQQVSSQPMKNNINQSYDSEPIQGRSFKVLQQITEPKGIYDGSQSYNSQSLPLSELRKLQLSDDDRSFMNRVKSQDMENPRYRGGSIPSKIFKVLDNSVDDDKFLHNETDPRYKGASIPSRSFRMLQTLTNSAPVPVDNNRQSVPMNNYVSEPIESKIYVPPSERPAGMEPHKYTGGSIPSRSFKMLQAMTGQNNEEEEENYLQNRSLTPYPFLSPEFWQHYNYLKEFHDLHTGAAHVQQQIPRLQLQQEQEQELQPRLIQQQQQQQLQRTPTDITAAYIAHVLNTIDEEETCAESAENASDSECEVTVTITLPAKKTITDGTEAAVEEETASNSPVDFWQQINDDGLGDDGGKSSAADRDEDHVTATAAETSSASDDSESFEVAVVGATAAEMSSSASDDDDDDDDSESFEVTAAAAATRAEASSSASDDNSESSEEAARTPPAEDRVDDHATATAVETSSASDDNESFEVATVAATAAEITSASDDDDDDDDNDDDGNSESSGAAANAVVDGGVDCRMKSEEDTDSGIAAGSSVNVSRQTSEKNVDGDGRGSKKKYQRTCTHSRLFNFLQRDDGCNDGNGDNHGSGNSNKLTLQLLQQSSTCTSGYSSAATTPSTPTAVGGKHRYESDVARAEYDSYYKSWEYACPYFGYDILPSKAFKTIMLPQNGDSVAAAATVKFKCPKIPTRENES